MAGTGGVLHGGRRPAIYDFAAGAGKHEFITARMENVGRLHDKLHAIVGDDAIAMVAETLNKSS